jgi:hypothetical protein
LTEFIRKKRIAVKEKQKGAFMTEFIRRRRVDERVMWMRGTHRRAGPRRG